MNKKTVFIILGIVILVALVAIGIILRKPATAPEGEESTPAQTETSTQPCETCAGGAAEAPTGTPAQVPAETPPAETPGLSSCVLLDEEYCKKGEPIYYHGSFAPQYEGELLSIGFNLPKGTKIYAPFDGLVGIGAMGGAKLVFINSPPLENTKTFFIKDVESAIPEKEFTGREGLGARKEVKKGELIGIVSGNIVDITAIGSEYSGKKYTVTIDALKGNAYDMNSYIPNSDLLRQYFSYLE